MSLSSSNFGLDPILKSRILSQKFTLSKFLRLHPPPSSIVSPPSLLHPSPFSAHPPPPSSILLLLRGRETFQKLRKREEEEERLGEEAYINSLKNDERKGLVKNGKVWLVWNEVGGRERLIGVGGRKEKIKEKQEEEVRKENQIKRRMKEGEGKKVKDARIRKEEEKSLKEEERRRDGLMSRKLLEKEKEVERGWRMRIDKMARGGGGGGKEEKIASAPNLNFFEMSLPFNNSTIKKEVMKPTSAKMSYSDFIQKVNNQYKFNGDGDKLKFGREKKRDEGKKKVEERNEELSGRKEDDGSGRKEEGSGRCEEGRMKEEGRRRERGKEGVSFEDIADSGSSNPRSETFFQMLRSFLCPTIHLYSFTSFILLLQIFFFILSLFLSPSLGKSFLQPDTQTLIDLGAKYNPDLKKGHIWRFFTPILLHLNFMHIFSNFLSQLIFGTWLESILFKKIYAFIYIFSAFGGNLLSALSSQAIGVGASTSIFGIFGTFLAYLLVNWRNLAAVRSQILCLIIIVLLFNFLASMVDTVDSMGHLGGLISGFLLGMGWVPRMEEEEREKKYKLIGRWGFLGLGIIGIVCFYSI